MSEYDTADMKNLHYHAFNYRNAHSTQAGNDFNTLEEFVSKMCIAASDRWREEWSEQCNENQILHNTCDEALAFIKELTKERDALKDALEGVMYWDNGKPEWVIAREVLEKTIDALKNLADGRYEERKLIEAQKDSVYLERNKLVALLSKMFPSGKATTAIDGWDASWHGCVYIDLPTGQASWHYHDSQAYLFEHLPLYQGWWDGHTTEEKYERIGKFTAPGAAPTPLTDDRIWELAANCLDGHFGRLNFARAIEADHGITQKGAIND